MMYLVITEKLTQEGKKNFRKVLEWQKKFDEIFKLFSIR
jgi:hypothetical protein